MNASHADLPATDAGVISCIRSLVETLVLIAHPLRLSADRTRSERQRDRAIRRRNVFLPHEISDFLRTCEGIQVLLIGFMAISPFPIFRLF